MEKVYRFDTEKLDETIDEVYGTGRYFQYERITGDDFSKVRQAVLETLDNYYLEDKIEVLREEEEITCLPDDAKIVFDKLFADKDLRIYGHGGIADKIMESGVFNCYYADLSSHFVPLAKTNECLSKLDNWPHRGHKKVAIMALNNTEYNPIYRENTGLGEYDTDRYSISTEYFVGYYDSELQKFILNPSFKREHEYNPENTFYENSDSFSPPMHTNVNDEILSEYLYTIYNILFVITMAGNRNLSERSYNELRKQIDVYLSRAEELHSKLTPEYMDKLKLEQMVDTSSDSFSDVTFDLSGWDDDWGSPIFDDEETNKTK